MDDYRQSEASQRAAVMLRRLVAAGLAVGMIAAPFLALIYSWALGLAMMAAALGAAAWLLFDAGRHIDLDPRRRRLILMVAGVNGVLALACLVVLAVVRPG